MKFLSLFSGIEAASVAWKPLSWECVAVAEVDPFCCALLKERYPNVPNLGDITKIFKTQLEMVAPVDIVVFGSPCQDMSLAGKRAGLQGKRSSLFYDAMRIVRWSGARFALWENVPGAFSSNEGRDFAAVVGEMVGVDCDVPASGWRNTGVALGPNGLVEWGVLDAQYRGLAQRRKRVFLVRDSGDWSGRSPILLERESLFGHPPAREKTRTAVAALTSNGVGTCGADDNQAQAGHLVEDGGLIAPLIAPCLTGNYGKQPDNSDTNTGPMLVAYGGNNAAGSIDGSEDDTGRVIPLVASTLKANNGGGGFGSDPSKTFIPIPILEAGARTGVSTEDIRAGSGIGEPGDPMYTLQSGKQHAVACSCKDSGADAGDIAPTLRSMNFDGSHANGGGQVAVAFNLRGREDGAQAEVSDVASLRSASGGSSRSYVAASAVRRLLPIECERLMGVPDNYTLVKHRGKLAVDGNRYRALGNSMAVPVMRYIGERIMEATR